MSESVDKHVAGLRREWKQVSASQDPKKAEMLKAIEAEAAALAALAPLEPEVIDVQRPAWRRRVR